MNQGTHPKYGTCIKCGKKEANILPKKSTKNWEQMIGWCWWCRRQVANKRHYDYMKADYTKNKTELSDRYITNKIMNLKGVRSSGITRKDVSHLIETYRQKTILENSIKNVK